MCAEEFQEHVREDLRQLGIWLLDGSPNECAVQGKQLGDRVSYS